MTTVPLRLRSGPQKRRLPPPALSPVRRPAPHLVRRRVSVRLAKRLLPLVALALLSLVALWPEFGKDEQRRFLGHIGGIEPQSGQLTDLHYNGVDDRDRPYTLTASAAHQLSPERVNLVEPKGDISLEGGTWMMVRSQQGVYAPHAGELDLSGEVVLYRDDGLTLTTDSATLDLRRGAAVSAAPVHAEGPFGSLDAQGFTVTDRGGVAQFAGPGRLLLNARSR